jgi:hypothetical protein
MGWDTYLTLNTWTLQSWSKHAPSEGRFLFKPSDLVIGKIIQPENDDEDLVVPLEYATTVGRAIAHLDLLGFTWDACVQA